MFCYADLCRHAAAFPDLTGVTRAEFDTLAGRVEQAEAVRRADSPTTRRTGQPRRHATGAGHPFAHDVRTRLVMALVWLRVYPTYAVLGFFFDLHKRNAQLNVRAILDILDGLDEFPFDRPTRDRTKLRSAAAVMAAFPTVRILIDGKEQRVNRPTGYEAQKPYYSGKKKCHTVKNQVVIDPSGRIEAISGSVPGGANHDLTILRASKILDALDGGVGAMMDKGYIGIQTDYPDVPLILPLKARRNHPLTDEQRSANRVIAQHRIVVEHTMAQLNRFHVLRQVFRGQQRPRHSGVIRVVAHLVNQRVAVVPLKTYAA